MLPRRPVSPKPVYAPPFTTDEHCPVCDYGHGRPYGRPLYNNIFTDGVALTDAGYMAAEITVARPSLWMLSHSGRISLIRILFRSGWWCPPGALLHIRTATLSECVPP